MRDFALAVSGVLVGGLMTLGGTVLQAQLAAQKETKAELRGKLELLVQSRYADYGCHIAYLREGKNPTRCDEGQFGWKAHSLAGLYFPGLIGALSNFDTAMAKGKIARKQCDIDFPAGRQQLESLKCVKEVLSKFTVSKEIGEVAGAISGEAARLRPSDA